MKFHTDCLIELTKPHLTDSKARRIDEIMHELSLKTSDDTQSIDSKSLKMSRKEQLRAELEDLIGSECILCGKNMIDMIDKPFITDEEWDNENKAWF